LTNFKSWPKINVATAGFSGKSGLYNVLHDVAFDCAFRLAQREIRR
jgi:protease II